MFFLLTSIAKVATVKHFLGFNGLMHTIHRVGIIEVGPYGSWF